MALIEVPGCEFRGNFYGGDAVINFCSTRMAAILLRDCDFDVYFQWNSMDQAANRGKTNLLHEHLYPGMLCEQVEQNVDTVRIRLGEPKGSVTDRLA